MEKIVSVKFSEEAEQIYQDLLQKSLSSKIEKSILNAINQKIEFVKQNPFYGHPIAKNLIPQEYEIKYGVNNLFRIELPDFWRMLYTLNNSDGTIQIIAFVIDILNHKDYNKKFRYTQG